MSKRAIKLPNKLSALLRLAVQDAQKCEAMPETYVLDMQHWHAPDFMNGKCAVCMAGAVIAHEARLPPTEEPDWLRLGPDIGRKTDAIDDMRNGYVAAAHYLLSQTCWADLNETSRDALTRASRIIHANRDPISGRADWDTYLRAADILEGAGL